MKNMKKTIVSLVLLAFVAMPSAAQDIKPFGDYLPADTMFVVSIPQAAEFKAFLERPEIKRLLDLVKKQPEFAEGYAQFKKEFTESTGIDPEEIYDRLAGDLTIAMLDFPIGKEVPDIVFTIGMTGGPDAVAADLDRIVAAAAEKEGKEVEELMIKGHRVYKIKDDAFFSDAFGHFMIASTANAVERFFSDGPRLNSTAGFARHRELVGLNEGVAVYVNFAPINDLLQKSISEKGQETGDEDTAAAGLLFLNEIGLDKVNGISLTVPLRPNSSARMFINAPGYDGMLAKIFSPAAVDRGLFSAFGAKTDSMMAMTIQDPVLVMDYFVSMASHFQPNVTPAMFNGLIDNFKQQTGIDIRQDLVGSMGTNVGFGFHLKEGADLNFSKNPYAFFQAMEIDMLWQLRNRAAFENAVNVLISLASEQMPNAFATESYKGTVIHSLSAGIPGVSFSMAIHDGYMRLATRDATGMKALVDSLQGGANAASAPGFQQKAQAIPAASNMLAYTSANYIRKYIELSLSMLPEITEDTPEQMAEFLTALRQGAMQVANKGRNYSGYALPVADGLYGEGEVDAADQFYIFLIEVAKYFNIMAENFYTMD